MAYLGGSSLTFDTHNSLKQISRVFIIKAMPSANDVTLCHGFCWGFLFWNLYALLQYLVRYSRQSFLCLNLKWRHSKSVA